MAERAFLESYDGQTTDELIALEARYRIDSLVLAFESALSRKAEQVGLQSLSWPERVVLAVESMEREVNSVGWVGFFSTPSQPYAAVLESALIAIECPGYAGLAARALAELRVQGPVDADSLSDALERGGDELSDALDDLDAEYQALGGESIERQLFAFIKANRRDIRLPALRAP